MAREKKPVVQFRWQAEGKPDPQPEICDVTRDQLAMADFSDDELANYAFMHGDRSDLDEQVVLFSMLDPNSEHLPRTTILTAVKERIKWLSRQLAIAQGTYPGKEAPTAEEVAKVLLKHPTLPLDELLAYEARTAPPPGSGFTLREPRQPVPFPNEGIEGILSHPDNLGVSEARVVQEAFPGAIKDLAELLGESTAAGKSLMATKPLSESDFLSQSHREMQHRKAYLMWEHNINHFLEHFTVNREYIRNDISRTRFVETLTNLYPELEKTITLHALNPNFSSLSGGAVVRYEAYTHVCNLLLTRYGVYIRCCGDIIGKWPNGNSYIAKSRIYPSGHVVEHPEGRIPDYTEATPSNRFNKDIVVVGGGSRRLNREYLFSGPRSESIHNFLKENGYVDVGPSVSPLTGKAKLVDPENPELTKEEHRNAHSLWFKEVAALFTHCGINPFLANTSQAESRILRLTKGLSPLDIRNALGNSLPRFQDRLLALRKVRRALDKGIAESQQRVRDQFGDLGMEEPKKMDVIPDRLLPKEQDD